MQISANTSVKTIEGESPHSQSTQSTQSTDTKQILFFVVSN